MIAVVGPVTGRRLAWSLYGLMLALLVVTVTLTVLNSSFEAFVAIAVGMMLGYGTMGAAVAARAPRNPLGWLMLMIGVGFVLMGLSEELLVYLLTSEPGSSPNAGIMRPLAAWISSWVFFLVWTPIPVILLLFPTGGLPSRRWRPVVVSIIATGALLMLFGIVSPEPIEAGNTRRVVNNPFGIEALRPAIGAIFAVGLSLLLATTLAAVAGLVLRFRRASGDERQQIRWLSYLSVVAVILVIGMILSGIPGSEQGWATAINALFFYAFFGCIGIALPTAMGLAILRFRLYDLDVVVKKTVVAFLLVGAITVVVIVLAIAVPVLVVGIGSGQSAVPLAIGIAIGFAVWPLRRRARRFADRVVYGRRATPYEVLSEFAERLGGTYSSEDVLPRMTQLLAQGTGATETVVWLRVGDDLRPVARWPSDGLAPEGLTAEASAFPVEHQGERLGVITLAMPSNDPMDPTKERLVRDVAGQASLVLRNVLLIEDLRESRRRIVSAQDVRARALERDIHDGAQQQLVALAVKARLARQLAPRDATATEEMLRQIEAETQQALEDLRDLARGIYPPLLADRGLAAAIEAQARKSPLPVTVEPDGIGRYPQDVESALYFSCLEALNNVAKYSDARSVTVRLAQRDGELWFEVSDDGRGFDASTAQQGTGLQGMADRLEAIGGSLEVRSEIGAGTTIVGRVRTQSGLAADQASSSRSGPNADLGM